MADIDVRGDIISNDDKWIYNWLDWDSTCPDDIKHALASKEPGEMLNVLINSSGGSVMAGNEIYALLSGRDDVRIKIQSMAGSAASVIAMANESEISPVGMIMIHNVSVVGASGDYHDMKKMSDVLKDMNNALANAYIAKTGKEQEEILRLMDRETWLTANQALEMGFVDEITGETPAMVNAGMGMRLTDEIREKVMAEKAEADRIAAEKEEIIKDLDRFGI